jgi:hypothetical protein
MRNRLTDSLGLGDIASVSEYNRLTLAILDDNWLYNEVVRGLVAERGAAIISEAHPQVRDKFKQRIRYNAPIAQIRIEWSFVAPEATASGRAAILRARRYFGNAKTHEEEMYWRPQNEQELARVSEPWTGSAPPPEALSQYQSWLHRLDPDTVSILKENALMEAEAAAKKQGATLTGNAALSDPLSVAINTQKAYHLDDFKDNSDGPQFGRRS